MFVKFLSCVIERHSDREALVSSFLMTKQVRELCTCYSLIVSDVIMICLLACTLPLRTRTAAQAVLAATHEIDEKTVEIKQAIPKSMIL